jgi:ABC-type phosphate transport system substrate-binding protein
MRIKLSYIILALFLFLLSSCNQNKNSPEDGPTYGEITVSADETLKPLIDAELFAFQSLYQRAKVHVNYKPEAEVFNDLLNNRARIIFVTRKLNKDELKHFDEVKIVPRTVKVAYDALALITNKSNKDLNISYTDLKKIISGKTSRWSELGPNLGNSKIELVFDNKNSSAVRFLKNLIGNDSLSVNAFALNNSQEVIKYITEKKDAIGIVGVNWVSENDSASTVFSKKIKLISISPPDTSKGAGDYYQPYQAYIAEKFYPLWRDVYIISGEARNGLGSGVIAFISSDKGQRIVLKAGLVPATMPVRLVEIKDQL